MRTFQRMLIYPIPIDRYERVKSILVSLGYKRHGEEWELGEDCVVAHTTGQFITFAKKASIPIYETIYSADEFISKFQEKDNASNMEHLQKLSVKIDSEEQYNSVTEVLNDLGYKPDSNPRWSDWGQRMLWCWCEEIYVLTQDTNEYGLFSQIGAHEALKYSYEEFMAKYKKPLDQQKQPKKKLSIKVSDKEEYMLVSEALRDMGYEPDPEPCWSDWDQKISSSDYHVITLGSGYSIHNHEGFPDDYFEYHTFTDFMMLFFRSLLKEFEEARTQRQPEVYDGVFSFDQDGANCEQGKMRMYWRKYENTWGATTSGYIEPHTLIKAGHEVGCFYLLGHGFDPERPTSYGLYDGQSFWRWAAEGELIKVDAATKLKVVKA